MKNFDPTLEYNLLFSGRGEFSVSVKFKGKDGAIPKRSASLNELATLLCTLGDAEQPVMSFDEHPAIVTEIRVDPIGKKVVLSVRSP